MQLHNLKPAPGSRKKKLIVGRGEGSTMGQTCGKGQKGQKSRSGDGVMTGFEGGQTPLIRRIPKRGFNHSSKIFYEAINVGVIDKVFTAGSEINGPALFDKGLLKHANDNFKVLGSGFCKKPFKFSAGNFSKSAIEAIQKVGGSIATKVAKPKQKKFQKAAK